MNKNAQTKPEIFGTKEWAAHTVNCCTGCAHDCKYCYARSIAVRFKRVCPENWKDEKIRPLDVSKKYSSMEGTVMFPSSHDISENNFLQCFTVLKKLLDAGNRVLVVSKPHLRCISKICDDLKAYKNKILFRFTITACDDRILSVWEPGAPCYEERKECLKYAFNAGYKTSVSVEPMLDSDNIDVLIKDLSPFVTESYVGWTGWNYSGKDVYVYNLETEVTTQLTDNAYYDYSPRISGSQIVWVREFYDDAEDTKEIMLFDGTAITQLTDNDFQDRSPRISNGVVVWYGPGYSDDTEIFLATKK